MNYLMLLLSVLGKCYLFLYVSNPTKLGYLLVILGFNGLVDVTLYIYFRKYYRSRQNNIE